jgi:hypothetical protein
MHINYTISIAILALALGGFIGHKIPDSNLKKYDTPNFNTQYKPGDIFKTYIPDMDVIFHFEPSEKINAAAGTKWTTYAYTEYSQKSHSGVCEIHLPSGKAIFGVVNDRSSNGEFFQDKYYAQAIAHEMLHCIQGDFHEN